MEEGSEPRLCYKVPCFRHESGYFKVLFRTETYAFIVTSCIASSKRGKGSCIHPIDLYLCRGRQSIRKAGCSQCACLSACIERGPSNAVERKLAASLSLPFPLAIMEHFRPSVRRATAFRGAECGSGGRNGHAPPIARGRTGDSVGALTSCGGAQWAHAGKSLPLTIL